MAWPPPSPHVFTLKGGEYVLLFLNGKNWDVWFLDGERTIKGQLDDWTTRHIEGTKMLQLFFEGAMWAELPILNHIKKG